MVVLHDLPSGAEPDCLQDFDRGNQGRFQGLRPDHRGCSSRAAVFECLLERVPPICAASSHRNACSKPMRDSRWYICAERCNAASPCVVIYYNFLHRHKVVCQSSTFALARNPRNSRHPLDFRPEGWLPTDENHPLCYPQFADDNRKGFQPFSQGPRMFSGREIAWWKSRVFIARVLWKCDDLEGVAGFKGEVDVDMDLEAG